MKLPRTDISFHEVLERHRVRMLDCVETKLWTKVYDEVIRDDTRLHLCTALQGTVEFDYVIPGMGKP